MVWVLLTSAGSGYLMVAIECTGAFPSLLWLSVGWWNVRESGADFCLLAGYQWGSSMMAARVGSGGGAGCCLRAELVTGGEPW